MKISVLSIILVIGQSALAQERPMANSSSEPQTQPYSSAVHQNKCNRLIQDLKSKFGFDAAGRIASQRSRTSDVLGFRGLNLEAMALKDGHGPRETIFPAPPGSGSRDIIAPLGSSTFRSGTGWAEEARTIPVFKITMFLADTENTIEVLAKVRNESECFVNHIKVYRADQAATAEALTSSDCGINRIDMDRKGNVRVNHNPNDREKACSAVWTYFGD